MTNHRGIWGYAGLAFFVVYIVVFIRLLGHAIH